MSYIVALGFTTAVLCGLWSWGSVAIGLFTWAGFAGCTTYFACGSKGWEGIKNTVFPNLSGVFWGMVIIILSNALPFPGSGHIYCAIVTYIMCIQSKIKIFSFIPGTFVGCFSTFAAGGDWKILVPSIFIGAFLGLACAWTGELLFEKFGKHENKDNVKA